MKTLYGRDSGYGANRHEGLCTIYEAINLAVNRKQQGVVPDGNRQPLQIQPDNQLRIHLSAF